MATTIIRFKYYHAWLFADAICNNSGLGFNGFEKDGNPKWDLISNINVISFEVSVLLLVSSTFFFCIELNSIESIKWLVSAFLVSSSAGHKLT